MFEHEHSPYGAPQRHVPDLLLGGKEAEPKMRSVLTGNGKRIEVTEQVHWRATNFIQKEGPWPDGGAPVVSTLFLHWDGKDTFTEDASSAFRGHLRHQTPPVIYLESHKTGTQIRLTFQKVLWHGQGMDREVGGWLWAGKTASGQTIKLHLFND